jgi:hypothetical protein
MFKEASSLNRNIAHWHNDGGGLLLTLSTMKPCWVSAAAKNAQEQDPFCFIQKVVTNTMNFIISQYRCILKLRRLVMHSSAVYASGHSLSFCQGIM